MRRLGIFCFFCIVCLLMAMQARAAHLMGGDLTYKNIGNNQVELTFLVYRDCNTTSPLDNSLDFRVYSASAVANKDYTKYSSYTVYLKSSKKVKPEIPNCATPSGVCIEQGIYVATITLGNDSVGYHVSWFRNERNDGAITNLEYGAVDCRFGKKEPFGSVWYTYIPAKKIKNSSPQFLTKPIPYLCAGKENVFNPLASDPDRDSLVFSLAVPYSPAPACPIDPVPVPYPPGHSDFSKVTYKSGYSVSNPFGGTSTISINSTTGEITASPTSSGNYVIAIQVKEYRVDPVTRKTTYVGEIRRDLQFVVGTCPSNNAPEFTDDSTGYVRYVYPEDTICFDVTGEDNNDTMYLTASGGVFKGTNATVSSPYATFAGDTGKSKVQSTFCWSPNCAQITYTSPHIVTFTLADNNCNSVYRTYSIYVRTRDIIKPPLIQCVNIQSDSTIKLTFYDSVSSKHFKQYKIYRKNNLTGTFTLADSINTQDTIVRTWTDKKTAKKFGSTAYSYYITAENTCGLEGLPSDTVSSIVVNLQKTGDKTAKASWNKQRSAKVWYKIYMDEGSGFALKDSTQNTSYIYKYCEKWFRIKIQVEDTGCTSASLPSVKISLKDITPPNINNKILHASVLNHNKIRLMFSGSDSDDVVWYYIYKSVRLQSGGYEPFTLTDSIKASVSAKTYTYTDTDVHADTVSYAYMISAKDACGNKSGYGINNIIHSTINLNALPVQSEKDISFSWNKYIGFTEDSIELQQYKNGSWESVWINKTQQTTVNYGGLNHEFKCGKDYFFRVVYRSSTSSEYSISDTVIVTPFDTILPAEVNIRNVSVKNDTSITITFDKVPDLDVKKYDIYFSENGGSFSKITTINLPFTGSYTYTHTGINALNNTYSYKVFAVDSCAGNNSLTSEIHTAIQLQGKEKNLSNFVHWNSYKGFKVKNYIVQKLDGKSWKNLAGISADTSYTDTGLACNIIQYYRIQAFEDGGDSAVSFSDTISLRPYDTIKPPKVTIHFVTVADNKTIKLSWQKSLAKDVKTYILTRTNHFSAEVYMDTILLDTFYNDTNITANLGAYDYSIRAMDTCANNISPASHLFSSIYLHDSVFSCEQKIYVKWFVPNTWESGIRSFEIYRSTDAGTESLLDTLTGNFRSYTDTNISNKHVYTYRVKAIQQSGNNFAAYSNTDSAHTFTPEKPKILYASKRATGIANGEIEIRWKSQKASPHIQYHNLYYRPVGGGSHILLAWKMLPAQDSFIHKNINTQFSDYEYILQSIDSCGNISDSSVMHKTMNFEMQVGQLIHDLKWTPYKGFDVDFYSIEQLLGGKWQAVETVGAADTALLRFPAPCNTAVKYRIKAIGFNGDEALSDSAGGQALDTIPANAPLLRNVSVADTNTMQIDFIGADSLDIFGYAILRAEDTSDFETVDFVPFTTPGDAHTYPDLINTSEKQFCYTILTLDSCLNFTASDTFCSIQLKGEAQNQANTIQWHRFKGYNVENYALEKWDGTNWNVLDTFISDTSFILQPLACGIAQTYRISAKEKSGSRITLSDTLTLIPFDTIIPPAPVLHYASVSGNAMQIGWSWNTASDVKYFEIWRKDSTQLSFNKIATVKYDSLYFDKSISGANHIYSYFVKAIDSCDNTHISAASDTDKTMQLQARTLACAPLTWLSWSAYNSLASGTDFYTIYRAEKGGTFQLLQTLPATILAYTDSAVTEGKNYCYRIEAGSKSHNYTALSDSVCIVPLVFPAPLAIQSKRATVTKTGSTDGEILLEWAAGTAADLYLAGYKIFVSENGGSYSHLADISGRNITSYIHKNIDTRSKTYAYLIYPYNICDENGLAATAHKAVNLEISNQNLKAVLQWNSYEGFDVERYEVEKAETGTWEKTADLPGNQTIFIDTNIYCHKTYTYRIKSVEKGGFNLESFSDTVTITAFDTIAPQASDLRIASVVNTSAGKGQIRINFSAAKDKNRYAYIIYRSVNNASFELLDTLIYSFYNPLQYVDAGIDTRNNTYSYFVRTLDSCGNIAMPLDTHRAILLNVTAGNAYNFLQWSPYMGFPKNALPQPQYVVERFFNNSGWQVLDTIKNGKTAFHDSDVHCNTLYTYRIITYNEFGEPSFSNTDTVRAYEHILPKVPDIKYATVTSTHNLHGKIRLAWKPSESKDVAKYLVYRKSANNNWILVATLPPDTFYNDENINTYRKTYQYKILALDSCANLSIDNSEIHQSVNLIATPQDSKVELDWNAYKGFKVKEYRLYKDGLLLKIFDTNTFAFADTFVRCKHLYNYKIAVISEADTLVFSLSNTDSLYIFDTRAPVPAYLVSASVSKPNAEAEILWSKSLSFDVAGYSLYRRNQNNEKIQLIYSTNNPEDTFYKDSYNITGEKACYFVLAFDDCGNTSLPGNNGCLMYLNGNAGTGKNTINWNKYTYWQNGVDHYNIYRRDDSNNLRLIKTVPAAENNFEDTYLPLLARDFCYQVEAVENTGGYNAHSFSTEICLQQQPVIYIPNAFTPATSLSLNDDFGPQGSYFMNFEMKIFNRWGERVYETKTGEGWTGKTKAGQLLPEGIYLYKITVFGYDGAPHVREGLVYLLW